MDVSIAPDLGLWPSCGLIGVIECVKKCGRHDQQIPDLIQSYPSSCHYWRVGRDHYWSSGVGGSIVLYITTRTGRRNLHSAVGSIELSHNVSSSSTYFYSQEFLTLWPNYSDTFIEVPRSCPQLSDQPIMIVARYIINAVAMNIMHPLHNTLDSNRKED